MGRGRFPKNTTSTVPYLCKGGSALLQAADSILMCFRFAPLTPHAALRWCGEADKIKNDIHLETCLCNHGQAWHEHDRTATLPAHPWLFRDHFSQLPVATCTRRARPKLFACSWLMNRAGNTVITPPPPPVARKGFISLRFLIRCVCARKGPLHGQLSAKRRGLRGVFVVCGVFS